MAWLALSNFKRGKKKAARRGGRKQSRFTPGLEVLERRICLSVLYDFNVVAKVGQSGLTGIEQGASINNVGRLALPLMVRSAFGA